MKFILSSLLLATSAFANTFQQGLVGEQRKIEYFEALKEIDFEAVKEDIKQVLTDSKDFWPADYGNYGPFFIRLAWHSSGSYRVSDGRGGSDGGRQRFDPERSWEDNTNLDKARTLLLPIKQKYGLGLSWGDLIVLTGTTAIEAMDGPVLGFCAGRVDDDDGSDSIELGPSEEQQAVAPCTVQGQCESPLGAAVVGLIYVNPEGYMAKPIPERSAQSIRDVFGRMGMNDTETVALIGGGHAFGKSHGACTKGAGLPPNEDPFNPWEGQCGTGKGRDTVTAGIEGPWTTDPIKWDNEYFKNIINYDWEKHKGPGGKWQWKVKKEKKKKSGCPFAPTVDGDAPYKVPTMMLTTDLALKYDKEGKYQKIIEKYADSIEELDYSFKHAWYKLVTRDMGPASRCYGSLTPPPQPFQNPLPDNGSTLTDWDAVRSDIIKAMEDEESSIIKPDDDTYAAQFITLGYQCSATYRRTDYNGGCNGARIRFSPEKDWPSNAGMNKVLEVLEPIKNKYEDTLSWADLISFAGNVAIEQTSNVKLDWCPGRADAYDGAGSEHLQGIQYNNSYPTNLNLATTEQAKLFGFTNREMVAMMGRPRSYHLQRNAGYKGTWDKDPQVMSNEYFKLLISETWEHVGNGEYKAKGKKDIFMMEADVYLLYSAELLAAVEEFASDEDMFFQSFVAAWSKLMIADRFDGPVGNVCKN